jgi:hypothetical protein
MVDHAVDVDAAEAACDAAYGDVEAIADMILASPIGSAADAAIKASILLSRGPGPADLLHIGLSTCRASCRKCAAWFPSDEDRRPQRIDQDATATPVTNKL